MTHGRKVCNTLKEIRRRIADRNEIEYSTSDCHFEGECKGTCPQCESEVRYLENELRKRTQLGKAVAVAGISLGMAGTFAGCGTPKQENTQIPKQNVSIEKMEVADTLTDFEYMAGEIDPNSNLPMLISVLTLPEKVKTEDTPVVLKGKIKTEEEFEYQPPLMGIVAIDNWANEIYEMTKVEVLPSFPGGDSELIKFLNDNLIYPRSQADFEAVVLVHFIIEEDGTINGVFVQKSPNKILSREAISVVKKMPKWIPGKQDGKPVKVRFILPIEFKLKD